MHVRYPLESSDRLGNPDLPFPISIVFGDDDWMDSRGARQIVKNNKFFSVGESQLHVLPDSGHAMNFDNPKALAELIINDLCGRIQGSFDRVLYSFKYFDRNGFEIYLDDDEKEFRALLQIKNATNNYLSIKNKEFESAKSANVMTRQEVDELAQNLNKEAPTEKLVDLEAESVKPTK